jgi:protein gp37
MADVFEQLPKNHPQLDWMDEQRARLWKLINFTPHLTWMLLTKRPENVLRMVPRRWWTDFDGETTSAEHWPRNVWIGATVEDQRRADERIPLLERIPARVRFLSVEPQLGVVVLPITVSGPSWWVIQGGESGRSARKFFTSWAGIMRTMCIARGVPYFLKQLGSNPREVCANCGGHGYPCELCSGGDVRLGLHDRAGADPEEWDDDMRVQQFPEVQP